jgi:hypothetical protein
MKLNPIDNPVDTEVERVLDAIAGRLTVRLDVVQREEGLAQVEVTAEGWRTSGRLRECQGAGDALRWALGVINEARLAL